LIKNLFDKVHPTIIELQVRSQRLRTKAIRIRTLIELRCKRPSLGHGFQIDKPRGLT
jgi:hypothetical protein